MVPGLGLLRSRASGLLGLFLPEGLSAFWLLGFQDFWGFIPKP